MRVSAMRGLAEFSEWLLTAQGSRCLPWWGSLVAAWLLVPLKCSLTPSKEHRWKLHAGQTNRLATVALEGMRARCT